MVSLLNGHVIDEETTFITMINSENLIAQVQLRFPDFKICNEMNGLPTVIFGFLTDKLMMAIRNNDQQTQDVFIHLINEMAETEEKIVAASFSEIVAVLYDNLKPEELAAITNRLSLAARNYLH